MIATINLLVLLFPISDTQNHVQVHVRFWINL